MESKQSEQGNNVNIKIVVFYCSTHIDRVDLLDAEEALDADELKLIELPCSGKVDIPYLMKAFEGGAQGVMVVTCHPDQCQYIHGSFRAENRVQAVDGLIQEIGLGAGRIVLTSLDSDGVDGVIEQIRIFQDKLQALPVHDAASVNT